MKILFLFILLNILINKSFTYEHCSINNKSTYLIPTANYCIPSEEEFGDKYYFGPCYSIEDCYLIEDKCMFAPGRERYCIGRDGHFCAFIDKGIFTNFFIVECG